MKVKFQKQQKQTIQKDYIGTIPIFKKNNSQLANFILLIIIALSLSSLAACKRETQNLGELQAQQQTIPQKTTAKQSPASIYHPQHALAEIGTASWYGGKKFKKGHKTSSGLPFDPNGYTAAHRFLPFGTTIRVTNLANNKTVDVQITDRGPHTRNRLIDISRQAAKDLDMLHDGVAKVKVEALACKLDEDGTLAGEFWVQSNAHFTNKDIQSIEKHAKKEKKEVKVSSKPKRKKQKTAVLIGPYTKLNVAMNMAENMHKKYSNSFIIAK